MPPAPTITPLVSQASGVVGSLVFSHNQHGPYVRTRTPPTGIPTVYQIAVRNAMRTLTARWRDTLTESERRSWDVYALNVPLPGRLGRRNNAGGLAMYIRSNLPRIQANEPTLQPVDHAPPLFDLPNLTPITRTVLNILDDTIHPFWDNQQAWSHDTGSALLFWASRPQPLTVNFWAGPYRYAGCILTKLFTVQDTPATIPLPVGFGAGPDQRTFIRYRLTRTDARLSFDARYPANIVPQVPPLPVSCSPGPFPPVQFRLTFDALIGPDPHNTTNWTIRYSNSRWRIASVHTSTLPANALLFVCVYVSPDPGPNVITFTPPPDDVTGLLTGLPVAAFSDFPIT